MKKLFTLLTLALLATSAWATVKTITLTAGNLGLASGSYSNYNATVEDITFHAEKAQLSSSGLIKLQKTGYITNTTAITGLKTVTASVYSCSGYSLNVDTVAGTFTLTGNVTTNIFNSITITYDDGKGVKLDPAFAWMKNGNKVTSCTAVYGESNTFPTLSMAEGFNGTVNYTSSNADVATIAADGTVTLNGAGTTTIKASTEVTDTTKSSSASYSLWVRQRVDGEAFTLVTVADSLKNGYEVIFVGVKDNGTWYAMGAQNDYNRNSVSCDAPYKMQILPYNPSAVFKLVKSGDLWKFQASDGGYLCSASDAAAYLNTKDADDASTKASVAFDEVGKVVVHFSDAAYMPELRFEHYYDNSRFSCYDAGGVKFGYDYFSLPYLYMRYAEAPVLRGDVNGDGAVNSSDVAALITLILNGGSNAAADVNGDGVVNSSDVAALIALILG